MEKIAAISCRIIVRQLMVSELMALSFLKVYMSEGDTDVVSRYYQRHADLKVY